LSVSQDDKELRDIDKDYDHFVYDLVCPPRDAYVDDDENLLEGIGTPPLIG
jgi:hypothetical protein